MILNDLAITSLETITVFDIQTGAYRFTLDELQSATIAQGQEVSEITGRGGRRLSSLKRNKTLTVSGTNGLVSGGLLEVQTGNSFENKATKVQWTDYLAVGANNRATTTYKAIGTAGSEIIACFVRGSDGMISTELEQAATASASGKFAYTPNTKELQFYSDITQGSEVVVIYQRQIMADVLANDANSFSDKVAMYIDALAEDKCANTYRVQFYIPKADFNGDFSLDMGDNQTVHEFEANGMAGACGVGDALWTYTVFGTNTADYAG